MYHIRFGRTRIVEWIAIVIIITSLIATSYSTQIVRAEGPNYATLLVVFGPDDIYSSRISFSETEISGTELLVRSGLTVVTQVVAGLGVTICKIEGIGCDFPGEACFCKCLGADCNYWSYWTRRDGSWIYAERGASQSVVRTGDINAWVWGNGQSPPPAISDAGAFETVLPSLTSTNTPVPPQIAEYGSPYPSGSETAAVTAVNTATYPEPGTATLEPSFTPAETPIETATVAGTVVATQTQPGTPTGPSSSATPAPSRASTAPPNSTITPDRSASVIAKVATNRSLTGVPTVAPAAAEKRSYWAFAGIALLLLLAIAYVLLLRRQRARSK